MASRYQSFSAPASVPGGITFAEPHYDPTNFAPRVGFAYSPGKQGAWSIRGGFSQAYDLVYSNLTANSAPPYFQQTNDCPGVKCAQTGFLASGGLPGTAVPLPTTQAAALGPVASYTFGGKRPYGLDWTLGVQHVFKNNYTFEARYVGTRGIHLWNQSRLNIFPLVNPNNYIPTFFSMPSAATFASLTKTLAQVKSYIVPGGTAAEPYQRSRHLRFAGEYRRLCSTGDVHLSWTGVAAQPALLQRAVLRCCLHLEPSGGRCYGDEFLNVSDAAARSGLPESQSRLVEFSAGPSPALHLHADL